MALNFDRVVIQSNGVAERLSAEQFLEIELSRRVALILGRQVSFYRGDDPVPLRAALRSLRQESLPDR